jgi:hypothetical protein
MLLNVVEVYFAETDSWFECKLKKLDFLKREALVRFPGKSGKWKREEWTPFEHVRGAPLPSSTNFTPGEKVEVLNSSSDDEPFSWWPAIALGVTADGYVIVTYEGWGDDYNDVFEPDLLRKQNKSFVLSSLTESDLCRIILSPALRKYLADGTLHFGHCDNLATLVPEPGVIMHIAEGGTELLVLGASLKMREVLKQMVRQLSAQALVRALDDFGSKAEEAKPEEVKPRASSPKEHAPCSPRKLDFGSSAAVPAPLPVAQHMEKMTIAAAVGTYPISKPVDIPSPNASQQEEDEELLATSWSVSKADSFSLDSCNLLSISPCSSGMSSDRDFDCFEPHFDPALEEDTCDYQSAHDSAYAVLEDDDSTFVMDGVDEPVQTPAMSTHVVSGYGNGKFPYYNAGVQAFYQQSLFELDSPPRRCKKNAPAFKQNFHNFNIGPITSSPIHSSFGFGFVCV